MPSQAQCSGLPVKGEVQSLLKHSLALRSLNVTTALGREWGLRVTTGTWIFKQKSQSEPPSSLTVRTGVLGIDYIIDP